MMKELSEDLLKVLACTSCKSDLDYDKKGEFLKCRKCKEKYDIVDGIPIMLPKE